MVANEDYLDNLLQSMLAEEGEDDGASKSLIDNSGLEESDDAITVGEEPSDEDAGSEESVSEKETADESKAALKESDMGESNEEVAGKTLTPEEIEAMFAEMDEEDAMDETEASNPFSALAEAEAAEEDNAPAEEDLLAMLENIEQDNPELSEINSLLEKSDNNEIVEDDMLALLDDGEDEGSTGISEDGSDIHMGDDMGEEELQETKGKKKRAKKEKKKKEKVNKEKPEKSGGGGPLAKLFNMLTEEEEPEQDSGDEFAYAGGEAGEGGSEGGEGAPAGKKKKDKKAKKEKKPKKEKPKKEKKPKKPKKEKPPKEKEPVQKGKPLPKKKTAIVMLFAASVFIAVYLFTILIPSVMEVSRAKSAYAENDYETVYELLVGRNRKKEEEKMYQAALLVKELQRPLEAYENYQELGMDIRALDALMMGVKKYQSIAPVAAQYGIQAQVDELYAAILTALNNAYGVSEARALEILSAPDSVYYTIGLKQVLGQEIPEISVDVSAESTDTEETASGENEDEASDAGTEWQSVEPEDILDAEEEFIIE